MDFRFWRKDNATLEQQKYNTQNGHCHARCAIISPVPYGRERQDDISLFGKPKISNPSGDQAAAKRPWKIIT
jgi:hypothetical protein